MLRLREDGLLVASKSISSPFAGFHLGTHIEQDGANLQRKVAVLKVSVLPTDGITLAIGGKTYTFKDVVVGADQIKIGSLVTNGTFAAGTDSWINYGGWTIAASKALHVAGAGHTTTLVQEWFPKVVVGYTYTTTYTVADRTAGTVRISVGGALGTVRNANGTYTEALVATSNDFLQFIPSLDFDGSVTAVIVTEPHTDLKGLTAQAIVNRVNLDTTTALVTAYNSLGLTTLIALVANTVGVTPTLTADGVDITKNIDWLLVMPEVKLEDTDYFKKNISTESDTKPIVLVERNAGTYQNFLY